ncbi:hypothetical protein Aglo03_19460 [Actinokineospora globicatena]|uniref:Uncharacterized protein n=1 Tax=Actinokineospora globicatena TaxID=103729 RepID=A0A9W6V641_9PSEU|nr:hypothetical protein Aglo03_19460 [Actinokineospora globicatena]
MSPGSNVGTIERNAGRDKASPAATNATTAGMTNSGNTGSAAAVASSSPPRNQSAPSKTRLRRTRSASTPPANRHNTNATARAPSTRLTSATPPPWLSTYKLTVTGNN